MNFRILVSLLGFILTIILSSCTSSRNEVIGFNSVSAKTEFGLSSGTKSNTLFVVDLNKMGQELVWSVWLERVDESLYAGLQSGMSSESILVYFEISADQKFVHLFEKKQNPDDPRGAKLIDRFPLIAIDSNTVTFDFAQGLLPRFFSSFINPKALSEFKYTYSSVYNFKNYESVVTFAQLLKLADANASTLIMHHAFRLFNDGNGFIPVKVVRPLTIGIMPASYSTDAESKELVAIRKWDTRNPIKFYVSNNTPPEFLPSIVEGLKWWNDALGFEFIEVEVLTSPTDWGDPRINVVQWSEDLSVCIGGVAIGPSEANPMTGQIYSGKIIFCGRELLKTYDLGINPETISRDLYYKKVMAWTAAHEMGHVLGFMHNFKGKLYHDPAHPEIINSTVMDYPVPNEIMTYNKVGPADLAKVRVSYLNQGQDSSVDELKKFPFCSDDETGYMPDCTRFVPGGMTPTQLTDRYLNLILDKKSFPIMENSVQSVVIKQLFTVGDEHANKAAAQLLRIYPGNKSTLIDGLQNLADTTRSQFALLASNHQIAVLKTLSDCILDCGLAFENQKILILVIGKTQTFAGFSTLQNLSYSIEIAIKNSTEPQKLSDLYRLQEVAKELLEKFWR